MYCIFRSRISLNSFATTISLTTAAVNYSIVNGNVEGFKNRKTKKAVAIDKLYTFGIPLIILVAIQAVIFLLVE